MSKDRGFKRLVGKTIQEIDCTAVNEVVLIDAGGTRYAIEVTLSDLGVPVIALKRQRGKKSAVVRRKPTARVRKTLTEPFPYPPAEDKSLD